MGNETMGKKDREKKKQRKQQDKADKREQRKNNNDKGKSLEEMMVYMDENGNLSSTPPDPRKRKEISVEMIQIGVMKKEDMPVEDKERNGVVRMFDHNKGYGFIKDHVTGESVFVHANKLSEMISEGDKVIFETENTHKGLNAIKVKKVI
jgi:cold shock CspA family protein